MLTEITDATKHAALEQAIADADAAGHPWAAANLRATLASAAPAEGQEVDSIAAWINYPVLTVDGEFVGYGDPEVSFSRPAYGYDIDKAEPLYRRAAVATAPTMSEADGMRSLLKECAEYVNAAECQSEYEQGLLYRIDAEIERIDRAAAKGESDA
jgi:hypothetical protein